MTRTRLYFNVFAVIGLFITLLSLALLSKHFVSSYWYDFLKDFSALFIAIGAAYLAFCFQQRQAFLFALRELWSEIMSAKTDVNYYVQSMHPDAQSYHLAYRSLSKAIDLVRGVYINVGETETEIGKYPFEPLHDIRRSLQALGFAAVGVEEKSNHVARIDRAWDSLRFAFLREFHRPAAAFPITEEFSMDPRRHAAK